MATGAKLGTTARDAALQALIDLVDVYRVSDSFPTELAIFDGTLPASPDDADGNNILCSITWDVVANPTFTAPTGGTCQMVDPTTGPQPILISGTASHFRIRDGLGQAIMQGTCGEASEFPVDIELNNKALEDTGTLTFDTLILTFPE